MAVAMSFEEARDILTRATGFMEAHDFILNPYSGCSFDCTYCYAAFFSTIREQREAWGQWVAVKRNARNPLEQRKPGALDGKRIYMSSVTDPYQPIERKLRLTRQLLEIIAEQHKPKPVVQTRSPDVVRDCDLFKRIEMDDWKLFGDITKQGGRVQVNMTVTTDDEEVRRTFEPSCPSNAQRLRAIAQVRAAGIAACVTLTPLIWVNDPEAFAKRLLDTGVKNFIVQRFHFRRVKFVAGTRDDAIRLTAEKLNCDLDSFQGRYDKHYEAVHRILTDALPHLGEGKDGFSPPF